jgi:regulator of protease activity HflC (stomatin/prohibitin superfamily)
MKTNIEKDASKFNGGFFLLLDLCLIALGILLITVFKIPILGIIILAGTLFSFTGFAIVYPNESMVLIFLGTFTGVIRESGFFWVNPFTQKIRVSLRVHNFHSDKIKVNDKEGNPIEIAAVISWKVFNSAAATFDVEKYESFVSIQSETAIRTIATRYPYDSHHDDDLLMTIEPEAAHPANTTISLRENSDTIAQEIRQELSDRLEIAGVEILEARISHLAYSPEIAQAMLRRQQAQAIIMARKKIVVGAVTMVEMALNYLDKNDVVKLDDEKKAQMVNNLLVTLTSDRETQPVINTGSLYS